MNEKEFCIKALENCRGDDLYRAQAAWGKLSPEDMELEYGESGRTRRQILDGYERLDQEVNKAIEWVKSQS